MGGSTNFFRTKATKQKREIASRFAAANVERKLVASEGEMRGVGAVARRGKDSKRATRRGRAAGLKAGAAAPLVPSWNPPTT